MPFKLFESTQFEIDIPPNVKIIHFSIHNHNLFIHRLDKPLHPEAQTIHSKNWVKSYYARSS